MRIFILNLNSMAGFRTKLDHSNRQVNQMERDFIVLSGGSVFGVPYSGLASGPDLTTTAITESYLVSNSTFSGNVSNTNYTWSISPIAMSIADVYLSALTSSNSGDSQSTIAIFSGLSPFVIDGNTGYGLYTGCSIDSLEVITMTEPSPGIFTGTVRTDSVVYSADSLDYTGRTIWADCTEILRTDRLIVKRNANVGDLLTCITSEGMVDWQPASGFTRYMTDRITSGTSYTFTTANILTVATNTATTINLKITPFINDFMIIKARHDVSLYPITISGSGINIDGAPFITISSTTNPSNTFIYDGIEYIII